MLWWAETEEQIDQSFFLQQIAPFLWSEYEMSHFFSKEEETQEIWTKLIEGLSKLEFLALWANDWGFYEEIHLISF